MTARDETVETNVVGHYGGGDLLTAIQAGVAALGKTVETVTIDDLGPVDEFHIGGRAATVGLCELLEVSADSRVLDVGCGIGGASRFVAKTFGCAVTGIDLSPSYIETARSLTLWTGLKDRVDFKAASALDIPVSDASFDQAIQLHVGMNIEDKTGLFAEVFRTLRPGGSFAVYDIMRVGDGEFDFPVPWATDGSMSFVAGVATYEEALEAAGFEISLVRDRGVFAKEFFAATKAKAAQAGGPAPLGLHLTLGAGAPVKLLNMVTAIHAGAIAPVEIIVSKPMMSAV